MSTLHVINKALTPLHISPDDTILYIEEGVYYQAPKQHSNSVHPNYVLEDDLKARGLAAMEGITVVTYSGFVRLCEQFDKVVSW